MPETLEEYQEKLIAYFEKQRRYLVQRLKAMERKNPHLLREIDKIQGQLSATEIYLTYLKKGNKECPE